MNGYKVPITEYEVLHEFFSAKEFEAKTQYIENQ